MSWTTPYSYTIGQTLTAANLNTYLSGNMTTLWPYTATAQVAVSNSATSLTKYTYGGIAKVAADITLGASGTIDFTSISGTWSQYILRFYGLRSSDTTARTMAMTMNNDSSSVYAWWFVNNTDSAGPTRTGGKAATAATISAASTIPASNDTAGFAASGFIEIDNPNQTSFVVHYRNGIETITTTPFPTGGIGGGYYDPASLASITRITLTCNSADTKFSTGGKASLYGVP